MASNVRMASRGMKELRIHLCQTSAPSQGVREFITTHYVPLKKANPKFPILIRECSGVNPRIWARYSFGEERSIDVQNKSKEDVLKTIEELVNAK